MKKYLKEIFLTISIIIILLLYRNALLGQLTGTFTQVDTPQEYTNLSKILEQDKDFGRTLWVPQVQRFAFYNHNHPAVSAINLYKSQNVDEIFEKISNKTNEKFLQDRSIKYVVVPLDTQKEIFLEDRKYSDQDYKSTIEALEKVPYLTRIDDTGGIIIFKVSESLPHIFSSNQNSKIKVITSDPTEYNFKITNANSGDKLTLTETYDPNWVIQTNGEEISTKRYRETNFNTFELSNTGNIQAKILYKPQKIVNVGSMISLFALIIILSTLIYSYFVNKRT